MTDPGGAETVMKQPTAQVAHTAARLPERRKEERKSSAHTSGMAFIAKFSNKLEPHRAEQLPLENINKSRVRKNKSERRVPAFVCVNLRACLS
jgi:hypothetical protein